MLLEGYYLRDLYGDIYAVKGVSQPPGRVYGIPKFVRGLGRLKTLQDAMNYLITARPEYVFSDPHTGRMQPAVPVEMISDTIEPSLSIPPSIPGSLRERAVKLVSLITDWLDSTEGLGFTGSILLGNARLGSDIDMVAYGIDLGRAIYGVMREMRLSGDTAGVGGSSAHTLLESRRDTLMAGLIIEKHDMRKVLTGIFMDTLYMIKLVPWPAEYWEDWSGTECRSLGRATVLAEIVDDSLGIFTPSLYRVRVREAHPNDAKISSIISFRSRFAEHCKKGELVMACGTLELVRWGSQSNLRLSIGWDPEDYIIGM
jgi:predicted nucleotidyltransferase